MTPDTAYPILAAGLTFAAVTGLGYRLTGYLTRRKTARLARARRAITAKLSGMKPQDTRRGALRVRLAELTRRELALSKPRRSAPSSWRGAR